MKELAILSVLREGALPEGKGAFLEVETNEGPRQMRFTLDEAQALLSALQNAVKDIQAARVHAGKPPLPEKPRTPARWETAMDPVNQVAVLRARFADDTTQDTQIPRMEIDRIARFLEQALKRFEAGGEMRQ
jgi:hypothetical protein